MDELTGQVSSQVTRINLVYSLSFVPADITRLCQEIWILQTCLDLSEILRCDLIIYFHNHDELYAWNAKFWSNSSLLRYNFSRQNKRLVWNDQKNMTTVMDKISKIAGSILPSKTYSVSKQRFIHVKSNHTFKCLYEYLNKKLRYRGLIYFILKLLSW